MRIFYWLLLVGMATVGYGQEEEFDIEFVTGFELEYDDVGIFSEGLAAVIIGYHWGYIDTKGERKSSLVFDRPILHGLGHWNKSNINDFHNKKAIITKNEKYGIIDKSGKELVPAKYDFIGSFSEGLAVVRLDDKWGYTDRGGHEILPVKYGYATPFSENHAAVKLNNKWAIIKKVSRKKTPFRIDWNQPKYNVSVTDPTYTIQATVHSSSNIHSIRHEIKNQKLDPVRYQPNRKIQTYQKDIQLQPGKNIITIIAENAEGEIRSKPLTITYKAIPKIWAVIVGVKRYQQINGLRYCADDAAEFTRFLASVEGGSVARYQTVLLTDEEATRERILTEIERIGAKIRPNDSFYFFFSGHGSAGAFKPYDFSHNFPKSSLLTHEDLAKQIDQVTAKSKIIIADACFAGGIVETDFKSDNPIADFYEVLQNNTSGTAILASCCPDQQSKENETYQRGIFSKYLFAGLNGKADRNKDKLITIRELFDYLEPKVRNDSNNFQRPVIGGKYDENTVIAIVR